MGFWNIILIIATTLAVLTTLSDGSNWKGAPAEAKKLEAHAHTIKDGNYRLRNAGSNKYITFYAKGNNLQMYAKGKGGDMGSKSQVFRIRPHKYKSYHGLTSIHHFNTGGNEKCLSAAWGSSSDDFGTMYACRVDNVGKKIGGHITSPHGAVPNDKQLWIFVPGHTKNTFRIITIAHLTDMRPRCLYPKHHQGNGAMGYYVGLWLNQCPTGNSKEYEWYLEKA